MHVCMNLRKRLYDRAVKPFERDIKGFYYYSGCFEKAYSAPGLNWAVEKASEVALN